MSIFRLGPKVDRYVAAETSQRTYRRPVMSALGAERSRRSFPSVLRKIFFLHERYLHEFRTTLELFKILPILRNFASTIRNLVYKIFNDCFAHSASTVTIRHAIARRFSMFITCLNVSNFQLHIAVAKPVDIRFHCLVADRPCLNTMVKTPPHAATGQTSNKHTRVGTRTVARRCSFPSGCREPTRDSNSRTESGSTLTLFPLIGCARLTPTRTGLPICRRRGFARSLIGALGPKRLSKKRESST